MTTADLKDDVNHPSHYTSHPSGLECIDIAKHRSGKTARTHWITFIKTPESEAV